MLFSSKLFLIVFGILLFASSGFCELDSCHFLKLNYAKVEENVFHRFAGNVRCRDGSKIRAESLLYIMELDAGDDDVLDFFPLSYNQSNPYRSSWNRNVNTEEGTEIGPALGLLFGGAEVYYKFVDVCFIGQKVCAFPEVFSTEPGNYDKDYIL